MGGTVFVGKNSILSANGSTFLENRGQYGGCFRLQEFSQANIANCSFARNKAEYDGGVLLMTQSSSATISKSSFTGKQVTAACSVMNSFMSLVAILFPYVGHKAEYGGIAMLSMNCVLSLFASQCSGNLARFGGCFTIRDGSRGIASQSILSNNSAEEHGGVVYLFVESSFKMSYSTLSGK